MLADGQDPNALEARLAFHLHRLSLTGEPLRNALNGKSRISSALTQARMSISTSAISELAISLGVAPDDLLRELTDREVREWAFYRTSARNRSEVWRNAKRVWSEHNVTDRQAAKLMETSQRIITRALSNHRTTVLDFDQATKLLSAFANATQPEQLLPSEVPEQ